MMSPPAAELLPFQTLPWTCGRVFLDPGPHLKSCFVNFGDLEKKYQLADVRNVGEISSRSRTAWKGQIPADQGCLCFQSRLMIY